MRVFSIVGAGILFAGCGPRSGVAAGGACAEDAEMSCAAAWPVDTNAYDCDDGRWISDPDCRCPDSDAGDPEVNCDHPDTAGWVGVRRARA